jgi:hypothetical protein
VFPGRGLSAEPPNPTNRRSTEIRSHGPTVITPGMSCFRTVATCPSGQPPIALKVSVVIVCPATLPSCVAPTLNGRRIRLLVRTNLVNLPLILHGADVGSSWRPHCRPANCPNSATLASSKTAIARDGRLVGLNLNSGAPQPRVLPRASNTETMLKLGELPKALQRSPG